MVHQQASPVTELHLQKLKRSHVCVDQPASESQATCGVFLQAHVKSQLVCERAGRRQAAQVLQQRREQAGEMVEKTLSVGQSRRSGVLTMPE